MEKNVHNIPNYQHANIGNLEQGNAFFFNFQVEPVLNKLENKQNYVGPDQQPHRPDGARTAPTTSDRGHHRFAMPTVPHCHFSAPGFTTAPPSVHPLYRL
jgi:hypothetical protein